jgi:hypothetical protein
MVDTASEIDAVLVARWRVMSANERASLTDRICRDVETIAIAGIRATMPSATDRDVRHELARRRYGSALADAAFEEAGSEP